MCFSCPSSSGFEQRAGLLQVLIADGAGRPVGQRGDEAAEDDAVGADDVGEAADALRDELGVLDQVGRVADDAWHQHEIVGQQVSVKAATTIVGRLVQRAGERVVRDDGTPDDDGAPAWRFPLR